MYENIIEFDVATDQVRFSSILDEIVAHTRDV